MALPSTMFEQLCEALADAFPSASDLERMVRIELSESLNQISSESQGLNTRVFQLVRWAEANGRVNELVRGARTQNQGNPRLRAFVERWGSWRETQEAPAPERVSGGVREPPSGVSSSAYAVTGLVVLVAVTGSDVWRSALPPPPSPPQVEPVPTPPSCPRDMVLILGGEFLMGSSERGDDVYPQHRVRLNAYCLDRTEVTVAAYRACVTQGACEPAGTTVDWSGISDDDRRILSESCNWSRSRVDDHPINCVSWNQAFRYCAQPYLPGGNRRLPTEAEWEFAARGTDGRVYPWGNDPPSARLLNAAGDEYRRYMDSRGRHAWPSMEKFGDDGWPTTAPVGSFPAGRSPFGLLDMAGNVVEWIEDLHGPYPPLNTIIPSAIANPSGPPHGTRRGRRGGGFDVWDPWWASALYRRPGDPSNRIDSLGFRCARSAL